MMKLGSADFSGSAELAALDCRVLLRFDSLHVNSRHAQAKLVKSYMRIIFNIPDSRDFIWSGYPSEPILAEAAARLLNNSSSNIIDRAPAILERALNSCLLAFGEQGELVIRTLFTVAHDMAIMKRYRTVSTGLHFHRPIRLLEFLENLCAPVCWDVVRNALPYHAFPTDVTLEEAFKDAWVSFSHFVQLGDFDSFNLKYCSELLKRAAAIQAYNNHWDGAIPIHFGDPAKSSIGEENTSAVLWQAKNANILKDVPADPTVIGKSETNLPILSIILQVGVGESDGPYIEVSTLPKGMDAPAGRTRSKKEPAGKARESSSMKGFPSDINRRHYIINLYACTSKTYRCIPKDSQAYRQILTGQKPERDFSRAAVEENNASFYALKPMMYDKEGIYMPWAS